MDLLRNVTTLGHVDHGKTTLTDALLAANNIISAKMAGKLRYLDSREDEQERGITMQSSAISLKFRISRGSTPTPTTYTINIIDTPGHVDFASEVSTASRLCDGALVLVDVVEGVCTQTIAVLRQAWRDQLRPILVVNKFDRLITELKLSPAEANNHLSRLIEQVNAVMGTFFAGQRMEDDWRRREDQRIALEARQQDASEDFVAEADEVEERDDETIYFSPDRGNVVFASAIDGWGFRVDMFAQLYAARFGLRESTLRRVLWGDFYLDPKSKKVTKQKSLRGKPLKPLFVQFVLENIWAVYESAFLNPDPEKISKIVSALNLKIAPKDLKSKDSRQLLLSIVSQWLPLTSAIIQSVLDTIPAPNVAQSTRLPKMLYPEIMDETSVKPKNKLEEDIFGAKSGQEASICAYVSKMFAVSARDVPRTKTITSTTANGDAPENGQTKDEILLGFARLYSGSLHVGVKLQCLLPKYQPMLETTHPRNQPHLCEITVEGLYTMMGRELVAVDIVHAGSIFAIKGLEGWVGRSATLCAPSGLGVPEEISSREHLINLGGVKHMAAPIVRVALEPVTSSDMPRLLQGLQILSHSDPCVQVFQQATGEHVILTAGELHLERCLKDLRERFAKIEINVSKPIVAFRETMVQRPEPNVPQPGKVKAESSHNCVTITIHSTPIPTAIVNIIQKYTTALYQEQLKESMRSSSGDAGLIDGIDLNDLESDMNADKVWSQLQDECQRVGSEWTQLTERALAFGRADKGCGGCVLVDARPQPSSHLHRNRRGHSLKDKDKNDSVDSRYEFDSHMESGFHLAIQQGPLCAEPIHGVAYFIVDVKIDEDRVQEERESNRMPQVASSVITAVKEGCHSSMLEWSPRLMLAMYTCDIQVSMDVLGKVYGVVARRHGRIIGEEIREGTSFFDITATLPVVESFGFADDIRKRTSGNASPQLIFSGFEMFDQDPFWVPTTTEELEDLGDTADRANLAKKYMDEVRERKGMFVDRKVIEFAEKQRTLKR